ncbi:hypothetical protein IWX83_000768 [Flavobacterium sp. CG_9.1]|uniref:hypothetical protein n=1 Tax=Flavobacterium sp. CG_9.1 TaxID=2787728 RepID=UPI0018CBEC1E|nr:hypothetical protein [Flavobacterium sp. CG_9.1]MBG6060994.1 hypothetical protein [Flavobacterium sp. CG_9.1]
MSRLYSTEITRNTGLTQEASILSCNYSNAVNTFKGNSVLISDRIENQEFKHFLQLKDKWKSETLYYSSSSQIFNNSAYREIIALGSKTIPWIIRELKKTNDHWFYALKKISGENPVNPDHYGIITKMKEDWIEWAQKNNY